MTVGRGVPIQQRDSQRVFGQAQCVVVAGPLRGLHRLLARAHRGVLGLKHPITYLHTVGPGDDKGEGCRIAGSGHRDGVVEVLPPPGTAQPPPGDAANCQRKRQRRSDTEAGSLGGVAAGQVDDGLRPPQDLAEFAAIDQLDERYERQPHGQGGIADRLEQRHLFGCQPRPLTRTPGVQELGGQPGHADGQRDLVPGRAAQLLQLRECGPGFPGLLRLKVGGTQHGAGGDAHRQAVGVVVG